jgi:Phospholipase_D-nuclease N-terminal
MGETPPRPDASGLAAPVDEVDYLSSQMAIPVAGILFLSDTLAWVLFVLIAIAWVLGLVDVVFKRHDLDRTKRLAWVLLIVILPIVGTLLYFALRPTLPEEAEKIISSRSRPS